MSLSSDETFISNNLPVYTKMLLNALHSLYNAKHTYSDQHNKSVTSVIVKHANANGNR